MRVRTAFPLLGALSLGHATDNSLRASLEESTDHRSDMGAPHSPKERRKSLDQITSINKRGLRRGTDSQSSLDEASDPYVDRYLPYFDWNEWREDNLSMPTKSPVSQPTQRPSKRTRSPSSPPTEGPSQGQPTQRPTSEPVAPTNAPSPQPLTESPTKIPLSSVPTEMPSTSIPTSSPVTSEPTMSPTQLILPSSTPTISPVTTQSPTLQPSTPGTTFSPTAVPTESPTELPTQLSPCSLNLTSSCVNCEGNTVIEPVCQGPPTRIIMRYTGGTCNQTSTTQDVPCFDFQGGPSTEPGSEGFVVVTFQNAIYHQSFVTVGEQYTIEDPTGAVLGAPQSIVVYRSEDQSPSNVLQSLLFDGDCSETLELLNRFGSSEVVGFTVNGDTTRAFFNASIELTIAVPSGPDARLESLLVSSSEGEFDVSGQVAGTTLSSGDNERASFTVNLDLTVPRVLLFLSNVTGTNANDASLSCSAESFLSIPVGPADEVNSGNFQSALKRGSN